MTRSKMAAKIVRTTKKAVEVFASGNVSSEKLQELVGIASQLTAKDINLDLNRVRRSRNNAPVSYMDIYGSSALTVCVFVLWEGSKMPMHNHPDMYGILKVLHGTVRVQSYSVMSLNNNNGISQENDAVLVNGWMSDTVSKMLSKEPNLVPARKHSPLDVGAGENVPPAVLRPDEFNIHAIECVDGPAAFLDILAPPYHEHDRDCDYFEEAYNLTPGREEPFVLLKPYNPRDFYSRKAEYRGPPVRVESSMKT